MPPGASASRADTVPLVDRVRLEGQEEATFQKNYQPEVLSQSDHLASHKQEEESTSERFRPRDDVRTDMMIPSSADTNYYVANASGKVQRLSWTETTREEEREKDDDREEETEQREEKRAVTKSETGPTSVKRPATADSGERYKVDDMPDYPAFSGSVTFGEEDLKVQQYKPQNSPKSRRGDGRKSTHSLRVGNRGAPAFDRMELKKKDCRDIRLMAAISKLVDQIMGQSHVHVIVFGLAGSWGTKIVDTRFADIGLCRVSRLTLDPQDPVLRYFQCREDLIDSDSLLVCGDRRGVYGVRPYI